MSVSDPVAARLALALDAPPAGPVAAFGVGAACDLSALGAGPEVVTGWRPDVDAFAARGVPAGPEPRGRYALSLVCLPRARAAARAQVLRALEVTDGPVLVDGQKTDGIEGLLREARARVAVPPPVARAHGKLFVLQGADRAAFADWAAVPGQVAGGFVTRPGVFSADGPDPGSVLLAGALPPGLGARKADGLRVADAGAGWGWLAAQLLAHEGVAEVHLVEACHTALACARTNLPDPRARFHWADATRFDPDAPFDAVVMNPPFHTGRAGDPGLGAAFIAAAARWLTPQGSLWMVANRHLPYEAALTTQFREVTELPASPAFKLFHARAPRPAGARVPPARPRRTG